MQEVYEFLKKCGTYYLGTVDGDQPRVRPFGTIDLFDGRLTIQTGKIKPIPVLLFGREFWEKVVNFQALVDEGVVSQRDLGIFTYVETAEEAWDVVRAFYEEQAKQEG